MDPKGLRIMFRKKKHNFFLEKKSLLVLKKKIVEVGLEPVSNATELPGIMPPIIVK